MEQPHCSNHAYCGGNNFVTFPYSYPTQHIIFSEPCPSLERRFLASAMLYISLFAVDTMKTIGHIKFLNYIFLSLMFLFIASGSDLTLHEVITLIGVLLIWEVDALTCTSFLNSPVNFGYLKSTPPPPE